MVIGIRKSGSKDQQFNRPRHNGVFSKVLTIKIGYSTRIYKLLSNYTFDSVSISQSYFCRFRNHLCMKQKQKLT